MASKSDIRRKKIFWRTQRRGSKELDILLGQFVARHIDDFSPAELDVIETWSQLDDRDIFTLLDTHLPESHEKTEGEESQCKTALTRKFQYFVRYQPKVKSS